MTAPATAFEGERGMLVGHSREERGKIDGVLGSLGSNWRIFGQSYKIIPTETITHAPVECVLQLLPTASAKRAAAELSAAALDWSLGRTDRAEQRYLEAIRLIEIHGADGTPMGTAWNDYAALLNEQERYDEAFRAAVEALAHMDAQADPRSRAAALGNRASAEDGLARFEDAERSYAESSAIFERLLPATAYDLSINLNNRAVLMRSMNRIADSIPLFEQAIALREQTLGASHGSLATLYANLSRARLFINDSAGARRDVERAVAIAEQSFAPDYQMLGHVYSAAAQIAAERADADEVRRLAALALAVYDRADAVTPERRQQVQDVLDALPQDSAPDAPARQHGSMSSPSE
jgi:tetratricopeptide (TPR) repeat protein